jgi:hypothetical protein
MSIIRVKLNSKPQGGSTHIAVASGSQPELGNEMIIKPKSTPESSTNAGQRAQEAKRSQSLA